MSQGLIREAAKKIKNLMYSTSLSSIEIEKKAIVITNPQVVLFPVGHVGKIANVQLNRPTCYGKLFLRKGREVGFNPGRINESTEIRFLFPAV